MTERLALATVAPEGYRAVLALNGYVTRNVDHTLGELIKIRASVINGCAHCIDMHTTDLLASGEDVRRVVAISAWRESAFFTPSERAALALTDAVTELGSGGVPDDVWAAAAEHFDDTELAHIVLAIGTINVWNRIALSTLVGSPPLVARV